jgi:hypothetical protein
VIAPAIPFSVYSSPTDSSSRWIEERTQRLEALREQEILSEELANRLTMELTSCGQRDDMIPGDRRDGEAGA